ncbi:MAG: hypothetical protein O2897_01735 [bacterium]|nr:hypothetical protein [bacterium]
MAQKQVEPKVGLGSFLGEQGLTLALFNKVFEQSYFLAHFLPVNDSVCVGMVNDHSLLLEQARMNAEISFSAFLDAKQEVYGKGVLSIVGRVSDPKIESNDLNAIVKKLKSKQVFPTADLILVKVLITELDFGSDSTATQIHLKT